MADNYSFRDYLQSGNNTTNVNVVGMSRDALSGIMDALDEQAHLINSLIKGISESEAEAARREREEAAARRRAEEEARNRFKNEQSGKKSSQVRSIANERRQRAANAAVNGKINKGLSLISILQDALLGALSKLINIVGDGFKQSLKSFSDLSKTMRQEKLTSEQRNNIGIAARSSVDGAKDTYGVNVSNKTANEAMAALIQKGLVSNINQMSQAVRDGYVAMVASGVDAQEAYAKATTLSTDQLRKEILSRSDAMVNGVITNLNSRITDVERLNMFGSADKASNAIIETAKGFSKTVGGFMSNESMADLGKIFLDFKTGNFAGMNEDAVKSALAVFGADINNIGSLTAEQLGENISKKLQEAGNDKAKLEELSRNLYILQKGQVGDGKILDELAQGAMMAQKDKNSLGRSIRTDAQNAQALADTTEGGKVFQFVDNIVSGIDGFTGGFLTKISNGLDEYFGDSLTLEDVVSSGFKLVASLLAAIVMSDVVKGGLNALKGAIGGALSLAGIGNGVSAAGAAGAATAGAAGTATGAAGAAGAAAAAKGASRFGKVKNGLKAAGKVGKKAGVIGLGIAGAAWIGNKLFGSSDENQQTGDSDENQQTGDIAGMQNISAEAGDYCSHMSSLVSDIRDAVCHISEDTPLNSEASPLNESNENLNLIRNAASSFTSPLEKAGAKMGENFAKKVAPDAVAKASEKAALKAAEKAAEKAALGTAEKAGTIVAKTGLKAVIKTADKFLGPVGAVVDAGISVYEVSQDLAEANRKEQAGKDLTFKLFEKQHELDKAKKSNDADAVARLSLEINNLESAIDEAAIAQETATDQAVVHGVGGATGIGGAIAGAAVGAAVGSIVPVIGTAIGGIAGGLIGGIGGWLAGEKAAEAAVGDTPEQRAEKIRQKREAYQAELRDREKKASEKGLSDSIAFSLVASAKDQAEFENKLDGIVKMQKLGLSEAELEFLAENAKSADEMQNLTKQLLSDPNKVYSNVGSIAVDISAMRTNLMSIYHRIDEIESGLKATLKFADGGIVTRATPAVVGEEGKEAIIPLERPDDMKRVLSDLSSNEKLALLKALLSKRQRITWGLMGNALATVLGIGSNSTSSNQNILDSLPKDGVPGDDQATLNRILGFAGPYAGIVYQRLLHGWKGNVKNGFKQRKKWYDEAIANAANQEGRELIRGTYAERALDYGVSELGKPYILRSLGKIGYVCNELVNACIQASGFSMGKFRVNGVKATFANIQKGKYSGNGYPNFRIRNDLTPQTAIPGMVFFQDSRKNREGGFQPGHIGLVYYGHQKLHASGGSSNYTKEGFLPNWQTPCRGVTVTPFDGSNYVIGEFPGLFEQVSGNFKSNTGSSIPFGPNLTAASGSEIKNYSSSFSSGVNSAVKKAGLLSDDELNELAKEAGLQNASAMTEFIKQAELLLNSNKDRDSIVAILLDIAKYLRGAVTSSKQQMVSVARPAASIYG